MNKKKKIVKQKVNIEGQCYWKRKENVLPNEDIRDRKGDYVKVWKKRTPYTREITKYVLTKKELLKQFSQRSLRAREKDLDQTAKKVLDTPVISAQKFFDFRRADVKDIDTAKKVEKKEKEKEETKEQLKEERVTTEQLFKELDAKEITTTTWIGKGYNTVGIQMYAKSEDYIAGDNTKVTELVVFGDTYEIRDALRELGGKYDKYTGQWSIPVKNLEDAKKKIKKIALAKNGKFVYVFDIENPDKAIKLNKYQPESSEFLEKIAKAKNTKDLQKMFLDIKNEEQLRVLKENLDDIAEQFYDIQKKNLRSKDDYIEFFKDIIYKAYEAQDKLHSGKLNDLEKRKITTLLRYYQELATNGLIDDTDLPEDLAYLREKLSLLAGSAANIERYKKKDQIIDELKSIEAKIKAEKAKIAVKQTQSKTKTPTAPKEVKELLEKTKMKESKNNRYPSLAGHKQWEHYYFDIAEDGSIVLKREEWEPEEWAKPGKMQVGTSRFKPHGFYFNRFKGSVVQKMGKTDEILDKVEFIKTDERLPFEIRASIQDHGFAEVEGGFKKIHVDKAINELDRHLAPIEKEKNRFVPLSSFWTIWRQRKKELKEKGYKVFKENGQWYVEKKE